MTSAAMALTFAHFQVKNCGNRTSFCFGGVGRAACSTSGRTHQRTSPLRLEGVPLRQSQALTPAWNMGVLQCSTVFRFQMELSKQSKSPPSRPLRINSEPLQLCHSKQKKATIMSLQRLQPDVAGATVTCNSPSVTVCGVACDDHSDCVKSVQ